MDACPVSAVSLLLPYQTVTDQQTITPRLAQAKHDLACAAVIAVCSSQLCVVLARLHMIQ